MQTAFAWTCPDCEHRNFVDGVTILSSDLTDQMPSGFASAMEAEHMEGNWMTCPDHVTCAKCSREFETDDEMEESE